MKAHRHQFVVHALPACVMMLFFSCTSINTPVAGGTSETTNGIVATAILPDSTPAAGAAVRLRPVDYLAVAPPHGLRKRAVYTANDTTDADGRFVIDSVSPGEYRIEVTDQESTAVLLTCVVDETVDSVVDLGTAVLRQFATLSGVVQTTGSLPSASVGVYGLERRVAVDSATGVWRIADLPAGDYRLRIEPELDEYGAALIDAPFVSAGDSASLDTTALVSYADEDYSAWAYSRAVRINTTASGADVTDDVYTFPLLVRLDTTELDFAQAAPDGRDIRFSKSGGTPLRYEIDFWNTDSSRAGVWVLMDTVRGNDSTQSITMHWGGPTDAPDFSSPSAVFDTANGHAMVWHVNETPARDLSVIRDATANGVDGESYGVDRPCPVYGVIGGAMSLGYPMEKIDTILIPEPQTEAIAFKNESFTISLWARRRQSLSTINIYAPGYEFLPHRLRHHILNLTGTNESGFTMSVVDSSSDFSNWNHYCVVVDRPAGIASFHANGELIRLETIASRFGELNTNGFYYVTGGPRENVDEIRIESRTRNSAWIKLCFETQRKNTQAIDFH